MPKTAHFQHMMDKIKIKLASWKTSFLSFVGRFQLLKSVVQSILIYSHYLCLAGEFNKIIGDIHEEYIVEW